ncbi:MAG: HpcH/HpaI aldolase family protein, partial [Rhizobiaceae bacterium]
PITVGVLASSSFDVVTLDMQHGGHSDESIMRCIGPVIQNGAHPIVRIPVGGFDMASRALDFGAEAVIAPMINTVRDARLFADSMKYPPVGERSWGPGRAMAFHGHSDGNAYFQNANNETLAIAMIETMEAVAIAAEILALPGIDGVFVGPSDLSIAWSKGAFLDPRHAGMDEMHIEINRLAKSAGKFAASFAQDGAHSKHLASFGYQLMAIADDGAYIRAGANALVSAAKG